MGNKSTSANVRSLPNKAVLTTLTTLTGGLSAMIGIGGGAVLVPLLNFFSVDMKKAIGCASACGIVIALFGSIGYISRGATSRPYRRFCWLCLPASVSGNSLYFMV